MKAVASYYGPTDFTSVMADYGERGRAAIVKFVGLPPGTNAQAYRRASPISYISRDTPPILTIHGDSGRLVPHEQLKRMLEACLRKGLDARLVIVANADYDFQPLAADKPVSITTGVIHAMTVHFFKKWLASSSSNTGRE